MVAGAAGDRVKQGGVDLDGSTGRDKDGADKQASESVTRRAMRDIPPGVCLGGWDPGWPGPPPVGRAWPIGSPAAPEQGTKGRGGRGPAGGNGPQAMRFSKVGPGHDGGSGGRDNDIPAGSLLLAEKTVFGLELPGARAMKQVAEQELLFVAIVGLGDAGVGLKGVPGLRAANSADDPSDRGDPLVVASSKEREAEKADLVQQGDRELPATRVLEKSLTDREVRVRIGKSAPKLVPSKRDGRAPVKQMLTGKLATETQRAMAKLALLQEDGGLAMAPRLGTFCGKAGKAAFADIGHVIGDGGPAVAADASGGSACFAPRDTRMLLTGSDPGGKDIATAACAALLGKVGAVDRPSGDSAGDAGSEDSKDVESSSEGASVSEGGPFLTGGGPPLPAGRAPDGPLGKGFGLPMLAAPVDLMPDGFVDGRTGPAEDITGDCAGSGAGDGTQTGLAAVLARTASRGPATSRGGRPPAADLPPGGSRTGSTSRPNPPVPEPAGDGGSSNDCSGVAGRALDLKDDAKSREGGPRSPPSRGYRE